MPFSSANAKVLAFLIELHLECSHAEYLIKKIRYGARHWRLMERGKDFDRKVPPRDIEIWASACLGCFNRIRQILRPGKRKASVKLRCQVLNKLIGPVNIDTICSTAVRHAWEHLDERLDGLFDNRTFRSYSHFSFALRGRPRRADHLDFRRFDPYELTLSFANETIPLKECLAEVRALNNAVIAAHDSLGNGRIVLWASN